MSAGSPFSFPFLCPFLFLCLFLFFPFIFPFVVLFPPLSLPRPPPLSPPTLSPFKMLDSAGIVYVPGLGNVSQYLLCINRTPLSPHPGGITGDLGVRRVIWKTPDGVDDASSPLPPCLGSSRASRIFNDKFDVDHLGQLE